MTATTAMCTSFKEELFEAKHNFLLSGGNTFKLALIKNSMTGTYGAASTNYSNITGNSDEASGTGYTAGGVTLTRIDPASSGITAFVDFADPTAWTITGSMTAAAAMIYDSTDTNSACSVHDFGGDKTATDGDFTITMPTADATNAILRLA
jgi:hypothetical protein